MVEKKLSLGIAIVLFLTYVCVLGFSLRTHKYFFQCREEDVVEESGTQWSPGKAVSILLIATAFVALLSEFLVGTIESVRHSVGVTEVFVGVIVVAIVGNAAEHSTAILMAIKNKVNLSVGIAIGSSLQIARRLEKVKRDRLRSVSADAQLWRDKSAAQASQNQRLFRRDQDNAIHGKTRSCSGDVQPHACAGLDIARIDRAPSLANVAGIGCKLVHHSLRAGAR